MISFPLRTVVAVALACAALAFPAHASIVIQGSRVVFPAESKDVSVRVSNPDNKPVLLQAWVDASTQGLPEASKAPFALSPAVSRLDPKGMQHLRVVALPNTLPKDRESVFYLHVLGIPPKPTENAANYVQIALRNVIKLFYRPAGLDGNPNDAHQDVTWTLVKRGKGVALQAHNPTPYHVSFANFRVEIGGVSHKQVGGGMVAPKNTQVFDLDELDIHFGKRDAHLYYTYIDDWGALREMPLALAS